MWMHTCLDRVLWVEQLLVHLKAVVGHSAMHVAIYAGGGDGLEALEQVG